MAGAAAAQRLRRDARAERHGRHGRGAPTQGAGPNLHDGKGPGTRVVSAAAAWQMAGPSTTPSGAARGGCQGPQPPCPPGMRGPQLPVGARFGSPARGWHLIAPAWPSLGQGERGRQETPHAGHRPTAPRAATGAQLPAAVEFGQPSNSPTRGMAVGWVCMMPCHLEGEALEVPVPGTHAQCAVRSSPAHLACGMRTTSGPATAHSTFP